MALPLTSLFAAAYFLWFIALSVLVIRQRRASKVGIGAPEEDEQLTRKIRVHGNFAEYTPMILFALFLLEYAGYSLVVLLLGVTYLLARASHAYGLLMAEPARKDFRWRVGGMATTFICLGVAALLLLSSALFG